MFTRDNPTIDNSIISFFFLPKVKKDFILHLKDTALVLIKLIYPYHISGRDAITY
ncbi:hypothetical protein VPHF96_0217 [Vibrio phage F96]